MTNRLAPAALLANLWLPGCGEPDPASESPSAPAPAPLAEPSAPCPALAGTGDYLFSVDGEDREAWVGVPSSGQGPYPVIFAFHGLADASFDAAGQLVQILDLEALVDERDVIVVAPVARETNLGVGMVRLWGILNDEDMQTDLTFYDDMRACLVDELDADPSAIQAFGFSGGGLWTSILVMERSDTLASAVTLSGGVDTYGPTLDWRAPASKVPVAVMDGGPMDAWPDPTLTIIDFHEASGSLSANLSAAGHVTASCEHARGHTLPPSDMWNLGRRWLLRHRFGEAGPWEQGGAVPEGCEVLEE